MTLATAAEAMKQLALTARDRIQQEYYLRDERKALHYSVAVVFPILLSFAFSSTGLASLIVSLWHLALRIVGTSLGIGLGLGLDAWLRAVAPAALSTAARTAATPGSG